MLKVQIYVERICNIKIHLVIHLCIYIFLYVFGGLKWRANSFAYVAHFVFLRYVWIRTQRPAEACKLTNNLATHLRVATHLPLSHPSPY
jgi:hypothetical protein